MENIDKQNENIIVFEKKNKCLPLEKIRILKSIFNILFFHC